MRTIKLVLLLSCLLVGLAVAAAGGERATLLGTLLDDDGSPLSGVEVTVRGAGFDKAVKTDRKGRFKLTVPDAEGEYEIRFEREGFPPYSEPLTFAGGGVQGREWTMNAAPVGAPTNSMAALRAFNEGAQAHNDGNYDLALQKLGEAVAEDPGFVEAHAVIAGIHRARGEHEQAATVAERVLALDADHVGALRILYDAQRALGREDASRTLDRLAELEPGRATAVLVYNEGVAARSTGDRQRARERYELAARLDPTLVQTHAALAGVLLELKDYEAALASSERALEIDPRDVRASSLRYNTLIAIGRHDEAKAMLDELQQVAPDAVAAAYFERGKLLFDESQIDLAIAALERAVAADPQHARAHYTLGLCYMNAERNEDARRHLETFIQLAPDDPDVDPARQLVEILGRSE